MERTLNETYNALYSSNPNDIEKNLNKFIEAKHNALKTRIQNNSKTDK